MVAIFPFGVSRDWSEFEIHVIDGELIYLSQQTYYNIQLKKLRQSKEKDGDEKQ
jgi:hypothetical protein